MMATVLLQPIVCVCKCQLWGISRVCSVVGDTFQYVFFFFGLTQLFVILQHGKNTCVKRPELCAFRGLNGAGHEIS